MAKCEDLPATLLQKHQKRLLKLLAKHKDDGIACEWIGSNVHLLAAGRQIVFSAGVIEESIRRCLVDKRVNRLAITQEGRACLLTLLHPDPDMRVQHMEVVETTISELGQSMKVAIDANESPLSRLYLRKGKNGESWINEYEFQAGEKLRADFEKAQLQPRVSANWVSSVATGGRSANTSAELSDFAVDARRRVESAVGRLGPELSGVVLDICCFLKGLETVERERRWPPRSAKLMLRTALRELVRHYGLLPVSRKHREHHWGANGYRPDVLV